MVTHMWVEGDNLNGAVYLSKASPRWLLFWFLFSSFTLQSNVNQFIYSILQKVLLMNANLNETDY